MEFSQSGNQVTGTFSNPSFAHTTIGTVTGTVDGSLLQGNWAFTIPLQSIPPSIRPNTSEGSFEFEILDQLSFMGTVLDGDVFREWRGDKIVNGTMISHAIPSIINKRTESIMIVGRNLPATISENDVEIAGGGIRILEVGRPNDSRPNEIAVLVRIDEDAQPGERTVKLRGVEGEVKIILYAFSIESDSPSVTPDTPTRVTASCHPGDPFKVSWEIAALEGAQSTGWLTSSDERRVVQGEVEVIGSDDRTIDLQGLNSGRVVVVATFIIQKGRDTLVSTEELELGVTGSHVRSRVTSVVPNTVCSSNGNQRIFVFGDNLQRIQIPNNAFGEGILVEQDANYDPVEYDGKLLVLVVSVESSESDDHYLARHLSWSDLGGDQKRTPHPVLQVAKTPDNADFLELFRLTGGVDLPASPEELVRRELTRRGASDTSVELAQLFGPEEGEDHTELMTFFAAGDDEAAVTLPRLRGKIDRAKHLYSNPGEASESLRSLLHDSNNQVGYFYGYLIGGYVCEAHQLAAELEEVFRDRLADFAFRRSPQASSHHTAENVIGTLQWFDVIDEDVAQTWSENARTELEQNPGSGIRAVVTAGPSSMNAASLAMLGVSLLTGGLATKLKNVMNIVRRTLRGLQRGRRISDTAARVNLLRLLEQSNVDDDFVRMIGNWDADSVRGLARMSTSAPNCRRIKRLADQLGDNAPAFFRAIDQAGEGGGKITVDGIKRFMRFRGGRMIDLDDINRLSATATRQPRGTLYGDALERRNKQYWSSDPRYRVSDLDQLNRDAGRGSHMVVVDVTSNFNRGRTQIVSITHGGLNHLNSKVDDLLGLAADRSHLFNEMQRRLRQFVRYMGDRADYYGRTRLCIPEEDIDPLRMVLASRWHRGDALYNRVRRYGLNLDDVMNMIQPLPR